MSQGIIGRIVLFGLLLSWSATGIGVSPQNPTPLLMQGKKSLYQRVLTRPEARLYRRAGEPARARPITPFTVYYVFDRKRIGDADWLEVGPHKHRHPIGWVTDRQVIDWKQTLILTFREPLGQDRVLLFKDKESLKDLIESGDMFGYHLLYEKAAAHEMSADSPVIAIQPKAYVDILEHFYLVPILAHEDIYVGTERGLLLNVAALPLEQDRNPHTVRRDQEYRSGIVFVIDSTLSMGPYIDRTRQAVRKIYRAIDSSGLHGKVSFGLVAYRDNAAAAPGLDYLTRVYATLDAGTDPDAFFERVDTLKPARVSSEDFREDAVAGIKRAIDDMDWQGYEARYVVLITDAGARAGGDPLASTGLDVEGLRQLARDKEVSIWVLHLLTPEGQADHATAAEQYRRLSEYPGIGALYYPVETGSVREFGQALDTFAREITQQVKEATQGVTPAPVAQVPKDEPLDEFRRKVATLGYALRMRYLQKTDNGRIPPVFEAWVVDRDIAEPQRPSLEVRVLLTRDQLSDLQYVLKKVLEAAEEGVFSPRDFLDELKSVAATLSRDPAATGASTRTTGGREENLADLGYMREYMEGLPYTGEVMTLSLQTWENWSAKDQFRFLSRLESKINYYQAIHDNTDLWVSLDGGPITGDSVFPIALKMLP
jgi:serine/threonine-protein kinase PpkA